MVFKSRAQNLSIELITIPWASMGIRIIRAVFTIDVFSLDTTNFFRFTAVARVELTWTFQFILATSFFVSEIKLYNKSSIV